MDVVLYQRAQAVFDEVVELPAAERSAALSAACAGDPALRALVEELLLFDEDESPVDNVDALLDEAADAVARPPSPLQPGATVDRYVALRLLGLGGTAQVWEVRHQTLESHHALKVLTWAEPSLQRRLLREGRTQAQLDHENLVPVHDVVDVNGAPGLLMPLVLGPALDELLVEARPTRAEALAILRAVTEGVGHAHALGFAHRDLKPGNVLMDLRGDRLVPRVADFGLVKGTRERTWTRPGAVMGTLSYAAPEQLADTAAAGPRADLWSLGIMLYELIAGSRPFRGRSLGAILDAQEKGPDLDPIDADLRPLVRDLLQPDPDLRVPDCAALLARLPDEGRLSRGSDFGRAADALAADRAAGRPTVLPAGANDEATLPPMDAAPRDGAPMDAASGTATPGEVPAPTLAAPPAQRRGWGPVVAAAAVALALGGGWWFWPDGAVPAETTAVPAPGGEAEVAAPGAAAEEGGPAAQAEPAGPGDGAPGGGQPAAAQTDRAQPAATPTEAAQPDKVEPVARAAEARKPAAPPAPAPATAAPAPREASDPPPAEPEATAPEATAPEATAPAEPAATAPEATAPEAPAPDPAVVTIDGETQTARLISTDGRLHAPGAIPPGRYKLEAKLPGRQNWVSLDLGALAPGQVLIVRCDARFGDCKVKR